jgi:hypothetical protein
LIKKCYKHGFEPKTYKVRYKILTTKLHILLCLFSVFSIFILINAMHYQFSPSRWSAPPLLAALYYVGLPPPCLFHLGPPPPAPPPHGPTTSTPVGHRQLVKRKLYMHRFKPKTYKVRYILLTTKLHIYLWLYSIFSTFIVINVMRYQFRQEI